MKIKVAIIAGGVGTRLWPVSREQAPKQVNALFGGQSVLQTTYKLLRQKISAANIFVVTGQRFTATVLEQLPISRSHVLVEPCRRDTAAAIGRAADSKVRIYSTGLAIA
jgi:mannose-1-phosphate guanylyltransferase